MMCMGKFLLAKNNQADSRRIIGAMPMSSAHQGTILVKPGVQAYAWASARGARIRSTALIAM